MMDGLVGGINESITADIIGLSGAPEKTAVRDAAEADSFFVLCVWPW